MMPDRAQLVVSAIEDADYKEDKINCGSLLTPPRLSFGGLPTVDPAHNVD